jgi:hypothetical protein
MSDNYGIPAYIPVQTDTVVTEAVDDYVDTCVTETFRTVGYTNVDGDIVLLTYLRSNSYLINTTTIAISNAVAVLKVLSSGNKPMAVWRLADGHLRYTVWTGNAWGSVEDISADCDAFDAVSVPNGCHLAWIVGAGDPGVLYVGQFIDGAVSAAHYVFPTLVATAATHPDTAVAIDVSDGGEIVVAWHGEDGDISLKALSSSAVAISAIFHAATATAPTSGMSVVYRGLRNSEGHWPIVLYYAAAMLTIKEIESTDAAKTGFTFHTIRTETIPLVLMETRAFRVGDEVFVWVRGTNSNTHMLMAGVTNALRCAVADREESLERPPHNGSMVSLANISRDPTEPRGTKLTWARKYNAGTYSRPGNARIGDMDFLPRLSTTKFGKSTYIAGSLVRCWDGQELGDAGFQDYPIISAAVPSNGSGSIPNGVTLIRIYAVRYNKQGERFQSVTVTSDAITMSGSNDTITVTTKPVVLTNHDDVKLEVYRTQSAISGDTFYLEKVVDNDRNAASIDIILEASDAALGLGTIDPHGPDTGQEIEEFGPPGCEIICTGTDRLWCIGGQIPAGTVVFSKRIEAGEGAGFDTLAGFVVCDATGGKLTSITPFGDSAIVAFQENKVYQVYGLGPSNLVDASGFDAPRDATVDGATTHWGTIVLPVGVAYWGADGPRILTSIGGRVEAIGEAMVPLTKTLVPSGVRADLARREVVWYTESGHAVLWNYAEVARTFDSGVMAEGSRWARWNNLPIAGVSGRKLVTTDGRVLTQSSTPKDDGRRFEFKIGTGLIRPEELLQDYTKIRRVGLAGEYIGPHRVRMEIYYDGAPTFSERFRWEPATNTWLSTGDDFAAMTAAEIDALETTDTNGTYSTSHRLERETCKFIRVVVSDCGDQGFTPWELSFEMAQLPGMGRSPVNTFSK